MGYFCRSCGNEEEFKATQAYTESGSRTVYIDNQGIVEDTGDYSDETDTEEHGIEDVICQNCESSNVYWEEDERVIEETKKEIKKEEENRNKITNWKEKIQGEGNIIRLEPIEVPW